jgi:hypothetical protein
MIRLKRGTMKAKEVTENIYQVGGADITDPRDCAVYLLDRGELVLIDAGAGPSYAEIVRNIEGLGLNPVKLKAVILTHCHIDHIGGAPKFRDAFEAQIIMHHLDAEAVEQGNDRMTAASWYNLSFPPMPVDVKLTKEEERLRFGDQEIICLHTPGHTLAPSPSTWTGGAQGSCSDRTSTAPSPRNSDPIWRPGAGPWKGSWPWRRTSSARDTSASISPKRTLRNTSGIIWSNTGRGTS